MSAQYFVHPTAIVDDGAIIGEGTRLWHFVHVCGGATIGARCVFGQNVFVGPGVVVGDGVKAQNNVSLYAGVTVEDDVFLGPSCVLTNVMNPRAHVERKDEFRPTVLRKGCSLGANCTVVCGVTIGEFAFIAAGAVVNRDVPPYALIAGVPGRRIGWMSAFGHRLDLPVEGVGEAVCPESGERYRLEGDRLQRLA